ncbi:MAG: cob(I)yrinic acid a,c-diamide adenosyltransferase [Bacillota bacterium]|nr:cob(I)yrinic acid a,c-diamide adenosyltransferase [Bacillota bacterium]
MPRGRETQLPPPGLVHYYYGDGKGKTSAAAGLALRLLASGRRVLILQFLKDGHSGEMRLLAAMEGAEVRAGLIGRGFSWTLSESEKEQTRQLHDDAIHRAAADLKAAQFDALILDEVGTALDLGLLDREGLLRLIDSRPKNCELILTGHQADPDLAERADYLSRIVCEKHPWQQGITAREGIEY